MKALCLFAIAALLAYQPTNAAGSHPKYNLDWPRAGEVPIPQRIKELKEK